MAPAVIKRSDTIASYKTAMEHYNKNEFERSASILDELVKNEPRFTHGWHLKGVIELKRGAYEKAEEFLLKALALDPKMEVAANNLGTAYLQQSKLSKAGDYYRKAIGLKPTYGEAHNHLGNVLLLENRLEDALGCYRRAALLSPENPEIQNNLGSVYSKMERYEDAEKSYRNAVQLRGFYPQAHNNLGGTLLQMGRSVEARNSFITAIAMNNQYGEPYQNLATNQKFTAGDPIGKMLASAEEKIAAFPPADRIYLQFVLGKYYDDLKQPDDAFKHLAEACAAKRKSHIFEIEAAEKRLAEIAAAFPKGNWADQAESGNASTTPIFIIGMPRSGTTLIEQILASHSHVHGAGEITAFSSVRKDREETWMPDLQDPKERGDLSQRGQRYVDTVQALAPEAKHVTDKMPHNFRYIGLIRMMLPNAKIIHCVRHPVDTCLSCFQQHFAEGQAWSYDLTELGRFYVAYSRLMEHWRKTLPGHILDVHYENVVDDLESEARRIIAHCGLEWDDSCLGFHENKRAVRTASQQQVREPIYNRSVGRWQPYEKHLGPLLDALAPVLNKNL
jgi:Flp pilus assembly protein TadD